MICPKCGATIKGGYRYVTCPNCGRTFDSTKLENVEEPAPAPERTAVPEPTPVAESAPAAEPTPIEESINGAEQTPVPEPTSVTVPEPAPRTAPAPEFVLSPTSESEHGPAPASKPLVQSNSYKNDKQVSFPSKQLVTDIHKELPLKSSFSLKNILIVAVASFIALFFSKATLFLLGETIFGGLIYPIAIYFPALCIGFILGPFYSVLVIVFKVLVTYLLSLLEIILYQLAPSYNFYLIPFDYHTYYCYPLFELLMGCLYVIPVAMIYWNTKKLKGYTFGVVIAIVIEMVLYVVLPYPIFISNTIEPYFIIIIKGILDSSVALLLFKWISKKISVKEYS